jgi:hypothetical protein
MTIGSNVPAQDSYVGNGSTKVFPIDFPVWVETDVVAYVLRDSDGVRLNLALTTDYTLNAAFDELALVDASQEWLDADGDLATGYTLYIEFTSEAYQPNKMTDLGRTAPLKFEGSMDRLAMIAKSIKLHASRALQASGGSGLQYLPSMVGNAGKIWQVNATEDGVEYGVDVSTIEGYRDDAIAAANAAATSETAAETAATAAALSAQNADDAASEAALYAGAADVSADAALESENNALASEQEAEQWAKYYAFTEVKTIDFSDSPYTVDYIVDDNVFLKVDTSGGNVVINLPTLSGMPSPDWKVGIAKATNDANNVQVNPFAGQTINLSSGVLLTDSDFGIALSDDSTTNWDAGYIAFGAFTGTAGGALPSGGTVGQVLTKNSGVDGDASWQDVPDNSIVNALIFG